MTKVTPKMVLRMKELIAEGKTHKEIGKELKIASSMVSYHTNLSYKKKKTEDSKARWKKMTKEQVRLINKSQRKYRQNYMKTRYHTDEEFRQRLIKHSLNYQRRQKTGT